MEKRKWIVALCALLLFVGVVYWHNFALSSKFQSLDELQKKSQTESTEESNVEGFDGGDNPIDGLGDSSKNSIDNSVGIETEGKDQQLDSQGSWGIVLFDGVDVLPDEDSSDNQPIAKLNTGDEIYLVEHLMNSGVSVKIRLNDGRIGKIPKDRAVEANPGANWEMMLGLSSGLSEFFLGDPESKRILDSTDFLLRASHNPNPVVSQWAQNILNPSASNASQSQEPALQESQAPNYGDEDEEFMPYEEN